MSTKIILKKLKEMGTIWHPESTVVFKSKEEKVVIGRWDGTELIDLDDDTIESCEKWGFKFDESLIEEVSEEEQQPTETVADEEQQEFIEETVDVEEEPQLTETVEEESKQTDVEEEPQLTETVEVEPEQTETVEEEPEHPREVGCQDVTITDIAETPNIGCEPIISQIKRVFDDLEVYQYELETTREKLASVNLELGALKTKFANLKSLLA
jgi:hypothetical protein